MFGIWSCGIIVAYRGVLLVGLGGEEDSEGLEEVRLSHHPHIPHQVNKPLFFHTSKHIRHE